MGSSSQESPTGAERTYTHERHQEKTDHQDRPQGRGDPRPRTGEPVQGQGQRGVDRGRRGGASAVRAGSRGHAGQEAAGVSLSHSVI